MRILVLLRFTIVTVIVLKLLSVRFVELVLFPLFISFVLAVAGEGDSYREDQDSHTEAEHCHAKGFVIDVVWVTASFLFGRHVFTL